MSTKKAAISIAPERHAQLKAIGAALGGLTITETVAHLINSEVAKGTIPPGIEGVKVAAAGDGLKIGFDEMSSVSFSREGVNILIEHLRTFANYNQSASIVMNIQHNFQIERRGSGVNLKIPFTAATAAKSFTRDLVRDLADHLERELAESKAA